MKKGKHRIPKFLTPTWLGDVIHAEVQNGTLVLTAHDINDPSPPGDKRITNMIVLNQDIWESLLAYFAVENRKQKKL